MEARDSPKLTRVRRLDSIRLDRKDATYFTDEGYLVDHPILTSCGIFEYKNLDGSVRRELRLPEHVFKDWNAKSVAYRRIYREGMTMVNKTKIEWCTHTVEPRHRV